MFFTTGLSTALQNTASLTASAPVSAPSGFFGSTARKAQNGVADFLGNLGQVGMHFAGIISAQVSFVSTAEEQLA